MSSCCPICLNVDLENLFSPGSEPVEESSNEAKLQKRFFILLQRYVEVNWECEDTDTGGGAKKFPFPLEEFAEIGMVACGNCLKLMGSFCELYDKMKRNELELNWEMERLKKIMDGGQEVDSIINYFRKCLGELEIDKMMESVMNSRKLLIEKCARKMNSSFPRLSILKYQKEVTIPTGIGGGTSELTIEIGNDLTVPVPYGLPSDSNDDNGNCFSDQEDQLLPGNIIEQVDSNEEPDPALLHLSSLKIEVLSSVQNHQLQELNNILYDGDDVDIALNSEQPKVLDQASIKVERGVSQAREELRRRRLRETHTCSKCKKTFSSLERLQSHQQLDHDNDDKNQTDEESEKKIVALSNEDNSDGDDTSSSSGSGSDSDSDMDIDLDYKLKSNDDSDSEQEELLDSTSDDLETDFELKDVKLLPHNFKDSKSKTDSNFRKNKKSSKLSSFRLKCPDCNALYKSVKDILLHRKDSQSQCNGTYDPKSTVRVEILVPVHSQEHNNDNDNDTNFTVTVAVIDLPQEIFICQEDSCNLPLYSFEDLETHKKLHGTFKCQFCPVTKSYAPDLCYHEMIEHNKKNINGRLKKMAEICCARCDHKWSHLYPCRYLHHNLTEHLSLPYKNSLCAICRTNEKSLLKESQLLDHFKSYHNLVNNFEPMKRCEFEDVPGGENDNKSKCPAYFRTKFQLQMHYKLHHNQKIEILSKKRQDERALRKPKIIANANTIHRLRCPDCKNLFEDAKSLLLHRKWSESCQSRNLNHDHDDDGSAESVRVEVVKMESNKKMSDTDTGNKTTTVTIAIVDFPQEIFSCDNGSCKVSVFSKKDLEDHKKVHGKFTCSFCKFEGTCHKSLAYHELKHSCFDNSTSEKNAPQKDDFCVKCPRCDDDTKFQCRKSYLRHHSKVHLNLPVVTEPLCPICKTNAVKMGRLDVFQHFRLFHDMTNVMIPDDLKRCSIENCKAYFLLRAQLRDHLAYRHNIGLDHGTASNLTKKRNKKKGNTTGKTEKKKTNLQRTQYKCRDCPKSYFALELLRIHRLKHHVPRDKVIICDFPNCSKAFESKLELENHVRMGGRFHKRIEKHGKFVDCPKCERKISALDPNFLKRHLEMHSERHVCEICGKSYKQSVSLKIHYLVHKGPESWEFMCQICSRKCITKNKLDQHMKIHRKEGEKEQFICQICGETYAFRHNLRNHVYAKHGEGKGKKFKCQICGVEYNHKHNLRNHIKSKHNGDRDGDGVEVNKCNNDDDGNNDKVSGCKVVKKRKTNLKSRKSRLSGKRRKYEEDEDFKESNVDDI